MGGYLCYGWDWEYSAVFSVLRAHGLKVREYAFPNHHQFNRSEFELMDEFSCLMTEKDAVKLKRWARFNHWYVPVAALPDPVFSKALINRLCQ